MLNQQQRLRRIVWMGSSFDDLRQFPEDVRRDAGFQLYRLQSGLEAADWKAMPQLGRGVEEIRLRHFSGAYRVIYLARFAEAIYVLHVLTKRRDGPPNTKNRLSEAVCGLYSRNTGVINES